MTSSRIQIVDNSEMNRTTIAHKNGQHVDLQVQGMTINFNFSDDKWGWGILLMFYDLIQDYWFGNSQIFLPKK